MEVQRLTNETMITLILIILFSCRIYYNPSSLFEKFEECNNRIRQKHELELVQHANTDKKIKELLSIYLNKYQGNRVWIIQYHEGADNYTCGSMRYELCDKKTISVKYLYNNFYLCWLELPYYLHIHNSFIGSIKELEQIDTTLYNLLCRNNTKYIICKLIRDYNNVPIGIFGISYLYTLPGKSLEADLQQDYVELQKLMLE